MVNFFYDFHNLQLQENFLIVIPSHVQGQVDVKQRLKSYELRKSAERRVNPVNKETKMAAKKKVAKKAVKKVAKKVAKKAVKKVAKKKVAKKK